MSSPQITENSKGLLLTLRIIRLDLPQALTKSILHIESTFSSFLWLSAKHPENHSKVHWSQSHTFELSELLPLHFRVFHKSGFFKEIEIGNCSVNLETFSSKKGIRISEVFTKDKGKITIIWGFVIDEDKKNENEEYLKLINEVEAEREEIKYYKNKVKGKLWKVKEKSRNCKEQLRKILTSMEPILEVCYDKEKICNDRALIIAERKRIDSQASEMLYLKVRVQKEFDRLVEMNSSHAEYGKTLHTL